MKNLKSLITMIILFAMVALIGCADSISLTQGAALEAQQIISPSGFFMGIWHGLWATVALFFSIFFDIGIYASYNTGWWYDLGFLIGVGAFAGGTINTVN